MEFGGSVPRSGTFESDENRILIITMEKFWPVVSNNFLINRLFKITLMKHLLDFVSVSKCQLLNWSETCT